MLVAEMTMTEFAAGRELSTTVLIPVGSVEEHGPHLPLGTDTIQAHEVGKRAAERIPLFVAPPVHYGSCRSTSCHPGTVSISTATLKALLNDIIRSFHRQGLKNYIILTGHAGGSHRMALQECGEDLIRELPDVEIAVITEYELAREVGSGIVETEGDSHAGEIETSRILHSHPHLVKGVAEREFPSFPRWLLVRDKLKFWPNGVWGDPTRATADKGKLIEERVVEEIVALVRTMEEMQKQ